MDFAGINFFLHENLGESLLLNAQGRFKVPLCKPRFNAQVFEV